jgi:hypothetical protein
MRNMNVIASLFLRAKHWQLFILSLILFLIEVFILRPHLLMGGSPPLIDIVFLLAWVWSVGSFLNSIVQPSLKFNLPFFYFALILPILLYALLVLLPAHDHHSSLALMKVGLRISALVCTIYDVGFVADLLVRAETGKPGSLTDVAGQFLMIWFFVLGVWLIQPRINRLYTERMKGSTPDKSLGHSATQLPE